MRASQAAVDLLPLRGPHQALDEPLGSERDPVRVGHLGEPGHAADRADVGRVAHGWGPAVRVLGPGASDGRERDAERERGRGPTSGRTHTGSSPASTSAMGSERCRVRLTTTGPPSPLKARATAWLAWVMPPIDRRATSAPYSRAARASAPGSSLSPRASCTARWRWPPSDASRRSGHRPAAQPCLLRLLEDRELLAAVGPAAAGGRGDHLRRALPLRHRQHHPLIGRRADRRAGWMAPAGPGAARIRPRSPAPPPGRGRRSRTSSPGDVRRSGGP